MAPKPHPAAVAAQLHDQGWGSLPGLKSYQLVVIVGIGVDGDDKFQSRQLEAVEHHLLETEAKHGRIGVSCARGDERSLVA